MYLSRDVSSDQKQSDKSNGACCLGWVTRAIAPQGDEHARIVPKRSQETPHPCASHAVVLLHHKSNHISCFRPQRGDGCVGFCAGHPMQLGGKPYLPTPQHALADPDVHHAVMANADDCCIHLILRSSPAAPGIKDNSRCTSTHNRRSAG